MPTEETAQERDLKAIQLAEARGRRQQVVDGRLDEHDQRFARINGSIDRTGTRLASLERKVDEMLSKMNTAEQVSSALARAAVSRREFWLGVAAVVATLAGALLAGGHFG